MHDDEFFADALNVNCRARLRSSGMDRRNADRSPRFLDDRTEVPDLDARPMTRSQRIGNATFSGSPAASHGARHLGLASTLNDVVEILVGHKKLIVAIALAGTALIALAVFTFPRTFTAEVQLGVGGPPGNVKSDRTIDESFLETQLVMLDSEAHLQRVIERLKAATGEAATALGTVPTVPALRGSLRIYQAQRSRVVTIRVTDRHPKRAAALANAVAQVHIDTLRDASRADGQELLNYLDRQIAKVGDEVQNADRAAQMYRVTHGISDTDTTDVQTIADVSKQVALARIEDGKRKEELRKLEELERSGIGKNAASIARLIGYQLPLDGVELPLDPAAHGPEPQATAAPAPEALQAAIVQFKDDVIAARAADEQLQDYLDGLQAAASEQLDKKAQLSLLERQAASASKIFEELLHRRQETLERVARSTVGVRVLNLASAPVRPNSSGLLLLVPGLFAFSLLGCAAALTIDRFGRTIDTQRHCEEAHGVPCVELKCDGDELDQTDVQRLVLAGLQADAKGKLPKVVLITSCADGEGRPELAEAIAESLAQFGRQVAIIDFVGPEDAAGADGDEKVCAASRKRNKLAATVVQIPATALHYGRVCEPLKEELFRLRRDYECVIINAPSVAGSSCALALLSVGDSVVVTLEKGRTQRSAAASAFALLQQALKLGGSPHTRLTAALIPPAALIAQPAEAEQPYDAIRQPGSQSAAWSLAYDYRGHFLRAPAEAKQAIANGWRRARRQRSIYRKWGNATCANNEAGLAAHGPESPAGEGEATSVDLDAAQMDATAASRVA